MQTNNNSHLRAITPTGITPSLMMPLPSFEPIGVTPSHGIAAICNNSLNLPTVATIGVRPSYGLISAITKDARDLPALASLGIEPSYGLVSGISNNYPLYTPVSGLVTTSLYEPIPILSNNLVSALDHKLYTLPGIKPDIKTPTLSNQSLNLLDPKLSGINTYQPLLILNNHSLEISDIELTKINYKPEIRISSDIALILDKINFLISDQQILSALLEIKNNILNLPAILSERKQHQTKICTDEMGAVSKITYLNTIWALKETLIFLAKNKTQPIPFEGSQASVIRYVEDKYGKRKGISKTTLETTFADSNKI